MHPRSPEQGRSAELRVLTAHVLADPAVSANKVPPDVAGAWEINLRTETHPESGENVGGQTSPANPLDWDRGNVCLE